MVKPIAGDSHMPFRGVCISLIACACILPAFCGSTWQVDRASGDDVAAAADETGLTAFQSIQAAVDRAVSGDTVLVGPGVYDNGSAMDTKKTRNRVWISGKKITLKSTHGASETHIVGQWDEGSTATNGCGEAQIRCICVNSDCVGTVIEGFTLRDGSTRLERILSGDLNDDIPNLGGGLAVYSWNKDVYLVDSVISNCTACWGGAMRGGTAIRCLITRNTAFSEPAGTRQSNLYSCLLTDNAKSASRMCPVAVNCTYFGNEGTTGIIDAYNCLFGLHDSVSATEHDCVRESQMGFQMFAPMMKDYRLLSGSVAATAGSPVDTSSLMGLPAEFDGKDFNGMPFVETDGKIAVGAFASEATPVCGGIYFRDKVTCGGEVRPSSYAFFDKWPQQICVKPYLKEGETFFRYRVTGANTRYGASSRWLQNDGTAWFVPPYAVGIVMTNAAVLAERILWADANYAEGDSDGTADKPYRTLQAAVDAVAAKTPTVIFAKEGDYGSGETFYNNRSNRVVIVDNRDILLKAVGAVEKTVIRGKEASPECQQQPAYYPGCGSDAVSCLSMGTKNSACAVQGFTFADGRSNCQDYTTDKQSDRCGGVEGPSTSSYAIGQILDCVFTNCAAVRGGAFYGVWASRCRIVDCRAFGGVTRYGVLSSTYVDRSNVAGDAAVKPDGVAANSVVGTGTIGVHLTMDHPKDLASRGADQLYQLANVGQYWTFGGIPFYGTVARNVWTSGNAIGYTYGAPLFVDEDNGDFRQLSTSCAISGGNFGNDGTDRYADAMDVYSTFAATGLDGYPIRYTEGVPMAGAYQRPVAALVVAASEGSISVNGSTGAATNVMPESVAVKIENGTRPVTGFIAGGKRHDYDGTRQSWTFYPKDYPSDETFSVTPIYGTNWYVNASMPDNSGNGFTAVTAKRTFHGDGGVMANVADGDCVHAADGVYDEGHEVPIGFLRRRLVVPAGVMVVADDGPEKTLIVGAPATESGAEGYAVDEWGRGTNAVACVYLKSNASKAATVRGFTLTGGRTHFFYGLSASVWNWDNNSIGGGASAVQSYDQAYNARVEDCIVSNNVSCRGGAFNSVYAINCRVFDNAANTGSCSANSFHQGCIVDFNRGANAVSTPRSVWNCTIGPGNVGLDGVATYGLNGSYGKDGGVFNTLCLGYACNVTNANSSIFGRRSSENVDVSAPGVVNCLVLEADEMPVNGSYAPVIGMNPAVDAGNPELAKNEWYGLHDIYGNPRAVNGERMDIGAVESDWRERYSCDIAKSRRFSVLEASPSVEESESGTVTIPDGGTLSVKWHGNGRVTTYILMVRLSGAGVLSVDINGKPSDSVSSEGAHAIRFMSALDENVVGFAYAGDGVAEIVSSKREQGSLMILR